MISVKHINLVVTLIVGFAKVVSEDINRYFYKVNRIAKCDPLFIAIIASDGQRFTKHLRCSLCCI